MNIVFFDSAGGNAYSARSLDTADNGLGGAEATLARVAIEFADRGSSVTVVQPGLGRADMREAGVRWIGSAIADEAVAAADVIVVQRRIADAWAIRKKNRSARIIVWYHDWYCLRGVQEAGPAYRTVAKNVLKANLRAAMHLLGRIDMVAVSETHKQAIDAYFRWTVLSGRVARSDTFCQVVYNPVSKDIERPEDIAFDRNKLIFFSAPWKGLSVVKEAFARLNQRIPELRLYVASPSYGYQGQDTQQPDNVIELGSLTHAELTRHVAGALCVFYPAHVVPETFGLVFVESHALGTPVLAHPFGSAPEMLTAPELVDSADDQQIFERISAWREGQRPAVGAQARFARSQVMARWARVLGISASPAGVTGQAAANQLVGDNSAEFPH